MNREKLTDPQKQIFGEGAVHMPFSGSLYMSDDGETEEKAGERFNDAMKVLGFEWRWYNGGTK